MKLTHDIMARAMRESDREFDGRFYVGVHSTGIYCLPSCRAKTPLLKNVRFYPTREEAAAAGLRACKRCRPEKYPDILPDWVRPLIEQMRSRHGERLGETDLAALAGVDASTVRRHFKQHLGMTAAAFHRRLRLAHARELLRDGASPLQAAFECGFESPSGFHDAFVREFGTTPGGAV